MRRLPSALLLVALLALLGGAQLALAPTALGQGSDEAASSGAVALGTYLDALAERRLIAAETGSIEVLREKVRRGEELYFAGRFDEAVIVLYEAVESPRFADFASLDEYQGGEFMLAGALVELGALHSASRFLGRLLARGPESGLFLPSFRRFVDAALESGDLTGAIVTLESSVPEDALPEDAANELRYLRARAAYEAASLDEARALFASITRRSRFYINALYFLGVSEVRRGDLGAAEAQFCSIATIDDRAQFSFYIDDRYFQVKDLAWLALGRVAHEGARSDDAFYYYFQVPADSDRVAEALFESAYAMYEGDDFETAVDLLDQLESRFPASPFVEEGMLLRGYVHLARCEFEEARVLFNTYIERFGLVMQVIDALLASPSRQARLHAQLLASERAFEASVASAENEAEARERALGRVATVEGMILSLLSVDPDFYRLHANIRTLDAEAARAGRLSQDLAALGARIRGDDAPRPAAEMERYETEAAELRRDMDRARSLLAGLSDVLAQLRRAGAPAADIQELRRRIRGVDQGLRGLERRLRRAEAQERRLSEAPPAASEGVEALLARDARVASRLPAAVARLRGELEEAATATALRALARLRLRIAGGMRRARIGRIDAVMGSKRRIEIQIESLAAGRFPPELSDALLMQGMLREDEEYWPFEGEYWADEFEGGVSDEADEAEEADEEDE